MRSAPIAAARVIAALVIVGCLAAPAAAQQPTAPAPPPAAPVPPPPPPPPPPPEPPWTGSIGAGFAFTSGNADTSTLNVSFAISSRAKARNVVKAEALYLRGDQEGEVNVDRLSFKGRDEYALTPRAFFFGQLEYLRDTFKDLDYLVAPTVGVGYKVIDTPVLAFDVDGGLGVKIEKSPFADADTSGAATAGQRFMRKLSASATVTQSVAALWTLDDFGDALYTIKAGLAANVTSRSQLKVELVDLYKTRPPTATVVKNDVSIVTAVVYKF